ncbi:MAG: hypothetical protein LBB58_02955 [Cellulomonadaceae bacterium]|nr:hypothetical protein [Cellulomonadaceae bacterium]
MSLSKPGGCPVETPAVEPVAVASLPVPSWPSEESASGLSTRSASVTETPDSSAAAVTGGRTPSAGG